MHHHSDSRAIRPLAALACTLALACCPAWISAAMAQGAFPSKTITIIVPFPAGGTTDIEVRLYANKLTEAGLRTVVDYKAGAGSTLGAAYVAKSAPDGHTLLAITPSFATAPAFYKDLPYDSLKDLQPVSLMTKSPSLLMVHPDFPAKTVREFIAYAKANPGKVNWGTTGGGGILHLNGEWFASGSNTKITFVHYKGTAPMLVDLYAGRVDASTFTFLSGMPMLKSGKLRAIGVSSSERSSLVPDLATVSEQGVPGFDFSPYVGILAPGGISAPVLNRINAELVKIVKSPEITQKFAGDGILTVGSSPEQFRQYLTREINQWKKLVQDNGIKLEE